MGRDFITEYVEYAKSLTDAPVFYHHAMAWSCLSMAVRRRIYLDTGVRIYPNLWVLLLGPSSRFRKSTSLSIAEDVLNAACSRPCTEHDNCVKQDVRTPEGTAIQCVSLHSYAYPNDFSKEALVEVLAERGQGIFFYSEVASLINTLNRDYNMGTMSLLTDLYDCPSLRERKIKSQYYQVKDVYLNIAAGSTIDWLTEVAKEEHFRGGFLSRFLYIVCKTKEADRSPFDAKPDYARKTHVINSLHQVWEWAAGQGPITASPEAKEKYNVFYRKELFGLPSTLEPLIHRYYAITLKLAVLFAANRFSAEISADDMDRAIVNVNACINGIRESFVKDFAFTHHEKDAAKVIEALSAEQDKTLSHTDLLYKIRLNARTFKMTIDTLHENGTIEIGQRKTSTKPITTYTLIKVPRDESSTTN